MPMKVSDKNNEHKRVVKTRFGNAPYGSRQAGASLVEFSIVALSVIIVGLFALQIGLLYHAKTTLNYATFEAGRVGAVNNANLRSMRTELGMRLAPLEGGDGTRGEALAAIAFSSVRVLDPLNTKIKVLNPTADAFRDWAVQDPRTGKRFIPVSQLRHQSNEVGKHSGLTLRDANLLKLQVKHGVDLDVPVVGKMMTKAMFWLDADNAVFYLRNKWPLTSVVTVRMQSDSDEAEVLKSVSNGSNGVNNEDTSIASADDTQTTSGSVTSDNDESNFPGLDTDTLGSTQGDVAESAQNEDTLTALLDETTLNETNAGASDSSSSNSGAGNTDPAPDLVDDTTETDATLAGHDCADERTIVLAQSEVSQSVELMDTGVFRQMLAGAEL